MTVFVEDSMVDMPMQNYADIESPGRVTFLFALDVQVVSLQLFVLGCLCLHNSTVESLLLVAAS